MKSGSSWKWLARAAPTMSHANHQTQGPPGALEHVFDCLSMRGGCLLSQEWFFWSPKLLPILQPKVEKFFNPQSSAILHAPLSVHQAQKGESQQGFILVGHTFLFSNLPRNAFGSPELFTLRCLLTSQSWKPEFNKMNDMNLQTAWNGGRISYFSIAK